MGIVYIQQEYERTVIKESPQELKEFVNEAVEEKIENEGLNDE